MLIRWHRVLVTRASRLDFMAADPLSAQPGQEKWSGGFEGVAKSRVARNAPWRSADAGSPPERRHQ